MTIVCTNQPMGQQHAAALQQPAPPKYAQVAKASLSPPPLPARPSTNMSHNHANLVLNSVANSMTEIDVEPPGYNTPDIIHTSGEQSNKYDPYYDNPEEAKNSVPMSKKPAPIPHLVTQDPTTMRWT